MTTEEVAGVDQETMISVMEEMAEITGVGPDFRADVPAGTDLGFEPVGDGGVGWKKRPSMVKMGDERIPDRMMLWNLQTGRGSPVATPIAQKRRLKGTKHYPASAFTFRNPNLPPPTPIDKRCNVCDQKRIAVGNPPKYFYDEVQYDIHMLLKHPMTMRLQERREANDERASDRNALRDSLREVIGEIVKIARPDLTFGTEEETAEAEEAIVEEITEQAIATSNVIDPDDYTNAELRNMVIASGRKLGAGYVSKDKLAAMLNEESDDG